MSKSLTNKPQNDTRHLENGLHLPSTKRYAITAVTVESQACHKYCFKCSHGGCLITPSNYASLECILYCKHHFSQLFEERSFKYLIKCTSMKHPTTPIPEL